MSYMLSKPFSMRERLNFIIEYNHNKGLRIEESENAIYALEDWEFLDNENIISNISEWEEEQIKAEAHRIAQLRLTKREIFLALYNDRGITPDEIRALIKDKKALIEFEYANEYYRGNSLIDTVGSLLGYSKEELDYLFEHKHFLEKKEV